MSRWSVEGQDGKYIKHRLPFLRCLYYGIGQLYSRGLFHCDLNSLCNNLMIQTNKSGLHIPVLLGFGHSAYIPELDKQKSFLSPNSGSILLWDDSRPGLFELMQDVVLPNLRQML